MYSHLSKVVCVLIVGFTILASERAGVENAPLSVSESSDKQDKSARALILSAPSFITEANISMNVDRIIEIFLPHPNSDGLDPTGTVNFRYIIRIMDGCEEIFVAIVEQGVYPYLWRSRFPLFNDNYQIQIARQSTQFKKETSPGTVLVGPPPSNPAISGNHLEIGRWLLHVPRKGGGFEGEMVFNNRFPTLPSTIWLAGFDALGNLVPNSQVPIQILGHRPVISIYGNANSGTAIYPAALEDKVSHIGLFESNNSRFIQAAITYKSIDDDSLTATVQEAVFADGEAVGKTFAMEARKSTAYWDGVAITNLSAPSPIEIDLVLRSLTDNQIIQRQSLGSVAPGEKKLHVISDLVPFDDNAYYTLEQTSEGGTFQVLGLRGSNMQDPPLLVGSPLSKVQ